MINKSMGQRGFKRPKNQEYQKQDRGVDKQIVGLRHMRFSPICFIIVFLGLTLCLIVKGIRVNRSAERRLLVLFILALFIVLV